ncbi:MAG: hypothetical protein KAG61_05440 [Bacteriovoracaceae bacterium]|nr:hypothetical protein [Bacteriovoracaceae bacterium]
MALVKKVGKLETIYLHDKDTGATIGSIRLSTSCSVSLNFEKHIRIFTEKDIESGRCNFADIVDKDLEGEIVDE